MIVITGNIASGKTTLARGLQKLLKGYRLLSIDVYRKRYSDGSDAGEDRAWDKLMHRVSQGDDCILEMTGVGQYYELCLLRYPGQRIVLKIDASPAQCLRAADLRHLSGYRLPPLPYRMDRSKSIKRIGKLLDYVDYDLLIPHRAKPKEVLEIILPVAG